jgi:hypothetical protein
MRTAYAELLDACLDDPLKALAQWPVAARAERALSLSIWNETVAPPADPDRAVRSQELEVVLRIDATFGDDWRAGRPARLELIYDSSRPLQSGATIARIRGLLEAYDSQVGTLRLIARGIHPAVVQPLLVGSRDVATPESRFDLAQQMLPYLLLLLAFIGGMQLAIDATAGERERQSLEPLLATPVSRETIISAKILATSAFSLAVREPISLPSSLWPSSQSVDAGSSMSSNTSSWILMGPSLAVYAASPFGYV